MMEEKKSLEQLFESFEYKHLQGPEAGNVYVPAIATDSRQVRKGSLFIALSGEHFDGHDFVLAAVNAGCAALLVEDSKFYPDMVVGPQVAIFTVTDTREILGEIVASFYDHPQEKLSLIGITGTNGKTTITYLLEKILADQGERAGVLGTVNYRYTDRQGRVKEQAAPLTTPDPLIISSKLREMVEAGVTTVIMEASSHALVQKRLDGIFFDIAAFTNLSHDHLDYHPSMEEYFRAKSLLFLRHLKKTGKTVITYPEANNGVNNKWSKALQQILDERGLGYCCCGSAEDAVVKPLQLETTMDGTSITLMAWERELRLHSPLVGRFNVDNIMTALSISALLGFDLGRAVASLADVSGAPGRLERVKLNGEEKNKAVAFVDYAHTPDALFNILKTLKAVPHERLICVFGCGGDRDRAKRPEMGRIAAELADIAIVTDDNPRSESSEQILAQIIEGINKTGLPERNPAWLKQAGMEKGYVVIADRRKAIHRAIQAAGESDIVVVAGKGHEKYQLTNQGKRFFDDCLEVKEAMLAWSTADVAAALGENTVLKRQDAVFQGISTDTRSIGKGDLFVALKGENFDGHAYLDKALAAGAGGVVVAELPPEIDGWKIPVFYVDNTLKALGDLAAYRRQKIAALTGLQVIGITGSTGKTTVKEMTCSILEKQWPDSENAPLDRVLKTRGNFNNLVGLPLSLLPLQLKHKVAVLEMGMNTPGEIARLAGIADPDISCIVNVHGAHLEGLGSIEGVAGEKEKIFAGTNPAGTLVVNLDDELVARAAEKYNQQKICYTLQEEKFTQAEVFATEIGLQEDGNMMYTLHIAGASFPVRLRVPGKHNVANSLAAASLARAAGVKAQIIVAGLEDFTSADKRLQIVRAAGGYNIINDTYNANPASMAAGLATLQAMRGGVKIAVLGDMLELGSESAEAHFGVGRIAAQSGLAFLLLVGSFTDQFRAGALAAGMEESRIIVFSGKEEIPDWIKELEKKGEFTADGWVLVKASRGMRMETVVEALI